MVHQFDSSWYLKVLHLWRSNEEHSFNPNRKKPYANLCWAFEFLTIIVGILNGNNKKNPNCTVNSGWECASMSARAWAIAHWPNYELIARPPRMYNRKNIQFTMMYESALANGLEHYKFYSRKTTNNRTIGHKKMPMPMLFLAAYAFGVRDVENDLKSFRGLDCQLLTMEYCYRLQ